MDKKIEARIKALPSFLVRDVAIGKLTLEQAEAKHENMKKSVARMVKEGARATTRRTRVLSPAFATS